MRNAVSRFVVLASCAAWLALGALALTACSNADPNAGQNLAPQAGTPAQPGGAGTPGQTGANAVPAATPAPRESAPPPKTAGPAAPGKPAPSAPATPAPPPPPPTPPRTFTLAEGTALAIQTSQTLSTNTNAAGEQFSATLVDPIVSGDWVVARQGADVGGVVVVSNKGGRVKDVAELEIALSSLTLADGQRIAVNTAVDATQAKSSKGKDATTIAIAAGVGAAIGAIAGGGKGAAIGAAAGGGGGTALVLGTRGGPAEIPARTVIRFKVTKAVEIVEKK
jgi:hypothetical protein